MTGISLMQNCLFSNICMSCSPEHSGKQHLLSAVHFFLACAGGFPSRFFQHHAASVFIFLPVLPLPLQYWLCLLLLLSILFKYPLHSLLQG